MASVRAIATALLLAELTSTSAAAREIVVSSHRDARDVAPGDGSCADTEGRCTLRAAVEEANAGTAEDIHLPAGKIFLSAELGKLSVTRDLKIVGLGMRQSRILGSRRGRIFETAPGVSLGLEDLALENGAVSSRYHPPEELDGGAIKSNGRLSLSRVRLEGNQATDGRGGAIFAAAEVFLSDLECVSNAALGGGCIYIAAGGRLVADGMVLRKNRAFLGGGGAVFIECDTQGNALRRVTTVHNTARKGFSPDFNTPFNPEGGAGGMNLCGDGTIDNAIFFRDRCRRCGAGAVRIRGGHWLIEHALFKDNQAHFYTAGLYVDDGAVVHVKATVFEGNDSLNRETGADFLTGNCRGRLASLGYNVERHIYISPPSCELDQPSDLILTSAVRLFSDGKASNGWTLSPLPGSVLVDWVTEQDCTLRVDRLNRVRPLDGDGDGIAECDAGPIEVVGVSLRHIPP